MNSPSSYPRPHLPQVVQPVDYLATVWRHLTEAVCQEVFSLLRENERQRKWSLFALLKPTFLDPLRIWLILANYEIKHSKNVAKSG